MRESTEIAEPMPPCWKKLFSWLWPIPEGKSKSALNPQLEWRWENGQLVLNSRLANYSYGSLHKVMRRVIESIPTGKQHRILLLGVGGGSALRLLESIPQKVLSIDAVDADPEVLRLAKSVFGIQETNTLKLHIADDIDFVKNSPAGGFDVVKEDVFIDLTKPDFCIQPRYMAHLARILAPGGKLFINSLPNNEEEIKRWKSLMQGPLRLNKVHRLAGSNLLWEADKL